MRRSPLASAWKATPITVSEVIQNLENPMQRLSVFALLCCLAALPSQLLAGDKPTPHKATHKEVSKVTPKHDGRAVELNTFTLDSKGNILACVVDSKSANQSQDSLSWLQVYSPDGELLRETSLPFNATAINEAASGIVFLAGSGQVAKVDSNGRLLTTADAPHLGDKEALRKQAEIDSKQQMEQITQMYQGQTDRVEEMMKALQEKEELTDRDKKRLKSLESQKEMFTKQAATMEEMYSQHFSVDAMLASALNITSLAVNKNNVFLCCRTGSGYDVWRTDHDFSSPSQVVSGLSGCCGQCDIQADEENLILAENTKFKVSLLDLDGKRLHSFGSRAGESGEGFGSCCNPMNVRCCSNGDILTAESSIGFIKRYNKEGEFLGTVGKANIGGGCKHVAIGFDEKRDRYYMQYQDKNQICVMWRLSDAPEFTADELAAKAAMEGLGQKLIGNGKSLSNEWSVTGSKPAMAAKGGILEALAAVLISSNVEAATGDELETAESVEEEAQDANDMELQMEASASYFKFAADGKLEIQGGYSAGTQNQWAAIRQDESADTLIIAQLEEGIQYYNYKIKFIDDNTATFTMMYGDQEMSAQTMKRIPLTTK
ncbi:MAG: hypothetical protein ABJZ55_07840 [Fuerstiella sp.]